MRGASGHLLAYGCLLILLAMCKSPGYSATASAYPDHVGPFVDTVEYRVIESGHQEVSALTNDDVDLIGNIVDPTDMSVLQTLDDVEVETTPRSGYGYLIFRTNKYPLNVTDFRRAFAFALDKAAICEYVWAGLAVPQDSCVTQNNPWSVEGQMPYTYYEADVAAGESLLDRAGFFDVDSDGWREAPDGSELNITIKVARTDELANEVGRFAENAFQALRICAVVEPIDFYEYLTRIYCHWDFDVVFLSTYFTNFDVDWLAYQYWSEYADEPYWNFPMWRNATYDSWREQLLHSPSYDEVYEASIEMQKVWVYECPAVVCCQSVSLWAHRTDRFEGFANDAMDGVPCWWTNYRVHLKDSEGGPYGGEFRVSIPLSIDTFNFMATDSPYTMNILDNLYDSLIVRNPDGRDRPWLAESYSVLTHDDDPSVTEGHTKFTFNIVRNATWTDGHPLTAEDVAFTFNYYRDGADNPYGADLSDMIASYAPTAYTAVLEFSGESYWHLHTVGYKPIIPYHIFSAIGPDNWSQWNPSPPEEEMVTSGPFNVSDHVAGEYCELTYNPGYFHRLAEQPTTTTRLTPPDTQTAGMSDLSIAATVASSIVISYVAVAMFWYRRRAQVLNQNRNVPAANALCSALPPDVGTSPAF